MPDSPANSDQEMQSKIRHRVANTFHFLAALARLRAEKANDPTPAYSLAWMADTIVDLGVLERYVQGDEADIHAYLSGMVGVWRDRFRRLNLEVVLDLCPLSLGEAVAPSFALAALELVANAAAHTFYGNGPHQIRLELTGGQGAYVLKVSDTGFGMASSRDTFGLWLVQRLAKQFKGDLSLAPDGAATLNFKA